jgi:hypothetical protein
MSPKSKAWALAATISVMPAVGHAFDGVTDLPGDFLATFAGSASSTDLDVIAASVLYDPGTDLFKLSGTMSGTVGSTTTGLYVWGVNRGAGVAGFAANGIDGVLFDRVILLRPNGTGTVPGVGDLAATSVIVGDNTITAVVPGSFLVSTGFSKTDYTWNLWPRDGAFAGFAAISDFAPDNAGFKSSVTAVPEASTLAMCIVGLAAVGGAVRRRRDIE